jgi:hypothetical protein
VVGSQSGRSGPIHPQVLHFIVPGRWHSLESGGTGVGADILTVVVNRVGTVELAALSPGQKTAQSNVTPTGH